MPRILVVDDEPALLALLATYLKRLGHDVTCFDSGRAGLEALDDSSAHFDVAILDHWLPDMSGIDLLHGVLERRPDISVLVSTGSFLDIESIQVPACRPVAFLQKPYLPKMLGEAIAGLLHSKSTTGA